MGDNEFCLFRKPTRIAPTRTPRFVRASSLP